jgi:hypothetical protein
MIDSMVENPFLMEICIVARAQTIEIIHSEN